MGTTRDKHIIVIGLGYVGLPLAVELARHAIVTGFDIDSNRIDELRRRIDRTHEVTLESLLSSTLNITGDPVECGGGDIFIVTVPTPVDGASRPDLRPLLAATETVAALLEPEKKPIIVYESTVYPGVTEDLCGPLIERVSGLRRGKDFFLGYSPERINPGDREHTINRIVKVVAGENKDVTDRLAEMYGRVTTAGVFRAKSIKIAEAAKVIENAQRDINIAFMNEITQIFEKLGLSTLDVLAVADTKWNFLKFSPGLVGGHCIGVDPYYLSHCAQSVGHLPRVVLAGRSINDGMATWVADRIHSRRGSKSGTILLLGVTFKEDVPDLRNSKVIELAARLRWLGHQVTIHDPLADPRQVEHEFGFSLDPEALDRRYDVVVAAVPHKAYRSPDFPALDSLVEDHGLLADLHGIWSDRAFTREIERWSL